MTHQFLARFASTAQRDEAHTRLAGLKLSDGSALIGFSGRDEGADGLYFGCELAHAVEATATYGDGRRFFADFYALDGLKSGCHHPDGVLWIAHDHPRVEAEKVSILDVFPTLHDLLAAPWQRGERRGQSLVPAMARA
jgi:hypothetical protein